MDSELLTGTLRVNRMRFFANHGLHEEESRLLSEFVVDARVRYRVSSQSKMDTLDQTVDYERLFHLAGETMSDRVDLIEELCKKIVDQIRLNFEAEEIWVRVEKVNPPVKGIGSTSFELSV